ncbi:hypothetical protein BGZ63DRAFT_49503 [Mariannaea sp. PMI_226]|nr:hypothetical protein BGZ63DRAFT_49503 [Mariannaea sp. PMI_226]
MSSRLLIPTAPQGQRCCLVLFKSSMGIIQAEYILVLADYPPEAFIQDVKDLYESKVSNAKRAYYRYILLSKPIISIVSIWEVNSPSTPGHNAFICEVTADEALTAALSKPDLLADMPSAEFLRNYGSIFLDAHRNAHLPAHAIMINLRKDPVAAKIAGRLVSTVSIGLGIGLQFAGV